MGEDGAIKVSLDYLDREISAEKYEKLKDKKGWEPIEWSSYRQEVNKWECEYCGAKHEDIREIPRKNARVTKYGLMKEKDVWLPVSNIN